MGTLGCEHFVCTQASRTLSGCDERLTGCGGGAVAHAHVTVQERKQSSIVGERVRAEVQRRFGGRSPKVRICPHAGMCACTNVGADACVCVCVCVFREGILATLSYSVCVCVCVRCA